MENEEKWRTRLVEHWSRDLENLWESVFGDTTSLKDVLSAKTSAFQQSIVRKSCPNLQKRAETKPHLFSLFATRESIANKSFLLKTIVWKRKKNSFQGIFNTLNLYIFRILSVFFYSRLLPCDKTFFFASMLLTFKQKIGFFTILGKNRDKIDIKIRWQM